MYKSVFRAVPRRPVTSAALCRSSRRCISTAPPAQKRRSWKSSAVRWGIVAAGIYYYNTSNVFAEEPEAAIHRLDESIHAVQESNQPTIDAIVEEKQRRQAEKVAEEEKLERAARAALTAEEPTDNKEGDGGLDGLEEEADQQGAFNPETGEINWECPCLGGMAHGPCGEEFKAAFSCFVYSNEEPKGVECIDKFKGMQDCFRQHPEMYASELDEDEDEIEEELRERERAKSAEASSEASIEPTELSPSPPKLEMKQPAKETRESLGNPVEGSLKDGQNKSEDA
ncbi:hypothetical protein B0O99DRAFT_742797 [Bisporella sp. PMI_857]|nr:hypothetical protein B0O99DRAFT_742797 [Bisporella sp. PMI_857]